MGIPRFYRWLKNKYPLIRFELNDSNKQVPEIDNFYVDFNALIYRCLNQQGTFLKNKVMPLTFQQIYQKVMKYLEDLIENVKPTKMLFIGIDGVAPRAKINQSRDRRFKAGKDSQLFNELIAKAGVEDKQNFKHNSISPGTEFLFNLCEEVRKLILKKASGQWQHLNIIFSDCNCPGQGQHKIMDFLRYSKQIKLFTDNTTHCIYSPDADVILLALGMELKYVCLIKEDTGSSFQNFTALSACRYTSIPKFEMVMINILSQYLQKDFAESLTAIAGSKIQDIINDFILLMAFVGNDFLPSEFCFTLKDNHMDVLYNSYRQYLLQNKEFINRNGEINWGHIDKLLGIATKFEATMIQEKVKNYKANKGNPTYQISKQTKDEEDGQQQLELYEVQNQKIIKGKEVYYQSRFNITEISHDRADPIFYDVIQKYIEGLEFYCKYYFQGLPSWNWFYPYHYTPLLADIQQYLSRNKLTPKIEKNQPFDPFLALMFMLPVGSFSLLPKPISSKLQDQNCHLITPLNYFPEKFQIDKFEPLLYNKRALIPFLKEQQVRLIYKSIPTQDYTQLQLLRNKRTLPIIIEYSTKQPCVLAIEISFEQRDSDRLKKLLQDKKKNPIFENYQRFPTLGIYGDWKLTEKGKIATKHRFSYTGQTQPVYFNGFIGYIQNFDKTPENLKEIIERQYQKSGIVGNCQNHYIIKQAKLIRKSNFYQFAPTRREVIVPDFATFKVPKFSYICKPGIFEWKDSYKVGERVVILNKTHFANIAVIQKLSEKNAQVRIVEAGYRCKQKLQQCKYLAKTDEQDFYSMQYVAEKLDVSVNVLLGILDQVCILPAFSKRLLKDFLPDSVNLGLALISQKKMLLTPKYVRCQMEHEHSKQPVSIFKKMELSKSCVELLKNYIAKFQWLIDTLEESPELVKKNIFARQLFRDEEEPNARLFAEFIKLFELKAQGLYYSIYSKVASTQNVQFVKCPIPQKNKLTIQYHQIISKRMAAITPPSLKCQPQFHDIGDRVIYLRTLQTGYITGIDDGMVYIKVVGMTSPFKVNFTDVFNEKWSNTLQEDGPVWNFEVSYFSPTYWKKAIQLQKH